MDDDDDLGGGGNGRYSSFMDDDERDGFNGFGANVEDAQSTHSGIHHHLLSNTSDQTSDSSAIDTMAVQSIRPSSAANANNLPHAAESEESMSQSSHRGGNGLLGQIDRLTIFRGGTTNNQSNGRQPQQHQHPGAPSISALRNNRPVSHLSRDLARGLVPGESPDARLAALVAHPEGVALSIAETEERVRLLREGCEEVSRALYTSPAGYGGGAVGGRDVGEGISASTSPMIPIPGQHSFADAQRPDNSQQQQHHRGGFTGGRGRGRGRGGGGGFTGTAGHAPVTSPSTDFLRSRQISSNSSLSKLCVVLPTNVRTFASKLVARTGFSRLVDAGVVSGGFHNYAGDRSVAAAAPPAPGDLALVVEPEQTVTLGSFRDAVMMEADRLASLYSSILNRGRITEADLQDISVLNSVAQSQLTSALQMITSVFSLAYARVSPSPLPHTLAQIEKTTEINDYGWIRQISAMLARCDIRKGPNADMFYLQHWVNEKRPTRVWHPLVSYDEVIEQLLKPNAAEADALHEKWTVAKGACLSLIKNAGPSLIPVVSANRYLFAFDNGWLDSDNMRFFGIGWPATETVFGKNRAYEAAINYFPGSFDTEGFSRETGEFDWTDRLPAFNPSTGWPDWEYDKMPVKHWSREAAIKILQTAIDTQQWDFHTVQNLYFALSRCARKANDNLQFHFFACGNSGTGKSTLCKFPVFIYPSDLVATIPSNIEAIFGLQQLIHETKPTFTKLLGTIVDMNGKMGLQSSVINTIVSQESVTFAVKGKSSRTAVCDMQVVWAANNFFTNSKEDMPALSRRFWIFPMDSVIQVGPDTVDPTDAAIRASMPAYIRRITLVWHEYVILRRTSPSPRIQKGDAWTFASPFISATKRSYAQKVSVAARMLGDAAWIIVDPNSIMSVFSLRQLSRFYLRCTSGMSKTITTPNFEDVKEAVAMMHNKALVQSFGTPQSEQTLGEDFCKTHANGLPCQLGQVVERGEFYVKGIRLLDRHVEGAKKFLDDVRDNPGLVDGSGNNGASDRNRANERENFQRSIFFPPTNNAQPYDTEAYEDYVSSAGTTSKKKKSKLSKRSGKDDDGGRSTASSVAAPRTKRTKGASSPESSQSFDMELDDGDDIDAVVASRALPQIPFELMDADDMDSLSGGNKD